MNPLEWRREHQIALGLAVVVGLALGLVIGYIAYAAGTGSHGAHDFSDWVMLRSHRSRSYWWALLGAAVGAALVYIRRLLA